VRFSDDVWLVPRGSLDHRGDGTGGRQRALFAGASRVGGSADKPGTVDDESNGPGNGLKGVGTSRSEDDVVRGDVGEDKPGLVQGRRQASLTNNVKARAGLLVG